MADDLHFLERSVERLAGPSLDIAMALYRDGELVRFIGERVRQIEPGDQRLAIALNADGSGPFVLFERSGHFVTCLSADMALQDAQLVTLEQVGSLVAQHAVWRARWAQARERGSGTRAWRGLIQRLYDGGLYPCREDFAAAAAFHALIAPALVRNHQQLLRRLASQTQGLVHYTDKPPKHSRQIKEIRDFWFDTMWLGTLPALLGLDPGRVYIDPANSTGLHMLSAVAFQSTYPAVMLRTYWMIARFGKRLLPTYRAQLRTTTSDALFMDAILALIAIGLGSRSLQAEVRKLLHGPSGPSPAWTTPFIERLTGSRGAFDGVFDNPQRYIDHHIAQGRINVHEAMCARAPELLARWPSTADVPEEVARIAVLHNSFNPLESQRAMDGLVQSLPVIVQLAPEQLFWPEELCVLARGPWKLAEGMATLERLHKQYGRLQPERAAPRVGRNAPCVCGSGKKSKRCCGG